MASNCLLGGTVANVVSVYVIRLNWGGSASPKHGLLGGGYACAQCGCCVVPQPLAFPAEPQLQQYSFIRQTHIYSLDVIVFQGSDVANTTTPQKTTKQVPITLIVPDNWFVLHYYPAQTPICNVVSRSDHENIARHFSRPADSIGAAPAVFTHTYTI